MNQIITEVSGQEDGNETGDGEVYIEENSDPLGEDSDQGSHVKNNHNYDHESQIEAVAPHLPITCQRKKRQRKHRWIMSTIMAQRHCFTRCFSWRFARLRATYGLSR